MAATIHDVAKRAGVSAGTASRSLRGHPQVSQACIARVRAAAEAIGYVPLRDRSGRARPEPLFGKRIAIAMIGIDRTLASLPVVAEAIHGAEEAIAESGAHPILVNVSHPAEPPSSLRRVRFDGIIAKAALQGDVMREIPPRLRTTFRETPLVWLLGRPAGGSGDAVDADDQRVGELAAAAVLDRGHRHVAIVNPKHDHSRFAVRGRAFRQVIEREGGTVEEFVPASAAATRFPLQPVMDVSQVQPLVDRATDGLRRRAARGPRPTRTAIFCPADSIAALVYRALSVRGLVAGRDVSVVSCNHERSLVAGLWPSLATVEVYPQRIGRMAVEQLTRRITGQFAGAAVQVGVEPAFVPGGSLGSCRAAPRSKSGRRDFRRRP